MSQLRQIAASLLSTTFSFVVVASPRVEAMTLPLPLGTPVRAIGGKNSHFIFSVYQNFHVSLNAATGGLEYVYEKGTDKTGGRVVVFGEKGPQLPGVQVVRFKDLSADEQDKITSSIAAMDSRDSALVTQQLVRMQEALAAAVAAKTFCFQ